MIQADDSGIRFEPLPTLPQTSWRDGGEASIYDHPTEREILVKVFRVDQQDVPRSGAAADRLRDLWSLSSGLSPSQSRRLSDSFSWPTVLYGRSIDRIDGIGIRRASDDFWLTYTNVHETITTVQNLAFLGPALAKPSILKAPYTSTSLEIRVEIAIELLRSMKVLWALGFRYCDYSENNILWAFKPRPQVFIIDVEGCARSGTVENFSPGWEPLTSKLGHTLESDRSQCVLAVWRILTGDMGKVPPNFGPNSPAVALQKSTVRMIANLRQAGEANLVDDLITELKQYREKKFEDRAFEWAISTKYARTVLDYAPKNPDTKQSQILQRATEQLALEDEIFQTDVRFRKFRLNRAVPVPGFEFDIAEESTNLKLQQDAELLREMALGGEFEEIAEIFATASDCMELNQVVRRSVQVALTYVGKVSLHTTSTTQSSQRFEWSWPGAAYANCARIQILGSNGEILNESIAIRNKNGAGVTLPINNDFPSGSRMCLTIGLATQNGQFVYSPFGTDVPIVTSPRTRTQYGQQTTPVRVMDKEWTPVPPRPPVMNVSTAASAPKSTPHGNQQSWPAQPATLNSNIRPVRSSGGFVATFQNFFFKRFGRQ